MRVIYDDTKLEEFVNTFNEFMESLGNKDFQEMLVEKSPKEIDVEKFNKQLQDFISGKNFVIGKEPAHPWGSDDDSAFDIYYKEDSGKEYQQCCSLVFLKRSDERMNVYLEDYNKTLVGYDYCIGR